MKHLEKLQTLLPLGYLYLIILGLLKETIMYYQLGINILRYSSITDILISPISDMASSPILLIATLLFISAFFILQKIIVKNSHKNWARSIVGKKKFANASTPEEIEKTITQAFAILIPLELLSLFIGLGVGEGAMLSKKIDNNELKYHYRTIFSTGKQEDIHIIDLNSSYYFYLSKGNKNIKIAPVSTITNLEILNSEKSKWQQIRK